MIQIFRRAAYSAFIFFVPFLFSSSQVVGEVTPESICALENESSCGDDVNYLRCRIKEKLDAYERLVISAATPVDGCRLFGSNETNFCVSRPAEMSLYCCYVYVTVCGNDTEAMLLPNNEIFYDEEADDEDTTPATPSTNLPSSAVRVIETVQESTTSIAVLPKSQETSGLTAPSVAIEEESRDSGLKPTIERQVAVEEDGGDIQVTVDEEDGGDIQVTVDENDDGIGTASEIVQKPAEDTGGLCTFIDDAVETATKFGTVLRDTFPYFFSEPSRSLGENIDNVLAGKKQLSQRHLQEEENVIVAGVQENNPTVSDEENAVVTSEDDYGDHSSADDTFMFDNDAMGLFGLLDSSTLVSIIGALAPDVDFSSMNFTQIELDVAVLSKQASDVLSGCGDCLEGLTDALMGDALSEDEIARMTRSQRKKMFERNEEALLNLTASEFSSRLVAGLGRFGTELQLKFNASNGRRLSSGSIEDVTMQAFVGDVLAVLRVVLEEDDLGGFMQKFMPILSVVNNNINSEVRWNRISTEAVSIYDNVFLCSKPSDFVRDSSRASSAVGRRLAGMYTSRLQLEDRTLKQQQPKAPIRQQHEEREQLNKKRNCLHHRSLADRLGEIEQQGSSVFQLRVLEDDDDVQYSAQSKSQQAYTSNDNNNCIVLSPDVAGGNNRLKPSMFQLRHLVAASHQVDGSPAVLFDPESPKEVNFIADMDPRRQQPAVADVEEKLLLQDELLFEGQPCEDRPLAFIESLDRTYSNMTCNTLITAVGCTAETFFLPLTEVIKGCQETWWLRCKDIKVDDPPILASCIDTYKAKEKTKKEEDDDTKGLAASFNVRSGLVLTVILWCAFM